MVEMFTRESALAYFITIKQLNKGPLRTYKLVLYLQSFWNFFSFMQIGAKSDPSLSIITKKFYWLVTRDISTLRRAIN